MAKLSDKATNRKLSDLRTSTSNAEPKAKPAESKSIDDFIPIPIAKINIDSNIRSKYNNEGIDDLAKSINQYGLLQPLRVYENENSKYVIIFGHRRYLACKKINKEYINCVVCKKPDTLENICIQITENEHNEAVNPADLEKYIHILKNKYKMSVSDIASKLNKSEPYIYKLLSAKESRDIHSESFDKRGLKMTSTDAHKLKDVNVEDVDKAAELITQNPGDKTEIIDQAAKSSSSKKKGNAPPPKKEKKPKTQYFKNSDILSEYDIIGESSNQSEPNKRTIFEFKFKITRDDINMRVKIDYSFLSKYIDPAICPDILKTLKNQYSKAGYIVEK